MPILLFMFLAGAFILAKKSQQDALAPSNGPPPTTGNSIAGGAAVGGGSAVGGVAGEIAAVAGAAVVGANLGKVVDRALGGDGTGARGVAAQVGGGAIAAAAVLLAFGTICPIVFAIVVATAVLVYVIVVLVDDAQELAYGQKGAIADYWKKWNQLHDTCFQKLRMQADYASWSDKDIERMLIPFVDGYMLETNRLAFENFMLNHPRGIGVGHDTAGNVQHGHWGSLRGKFVGDVDSNGKLYLQEDQIAGLWATLCQSWGSKFAATYCPQSEWVPMDIKETLSAAQNAQEQGRAAQEAFSESGTGRGTAGVGSGVRRVVGKVSGAEAKDANAALGKTVTVRIYQDPTAAQQRDNGRKLCNLVQYVKYMENNPDGVSDPNARVRTGLAHGVYEGGPGSSTPGALVYLGTEFDFNALNAMVN